MTTPIRVPYRIVPIDRYQTRIECALAVNGFPSRSVRLAEALFKAVRWLPGENAFIVTHDQAIRFSILFNAGYDGSLIGSKLIKPKRSDTPIRACHLDTPIIEIKE